MDGRSAWLLVVALGPLGAVYAEDATAQAGLAPPMVPGARATLVAKNGRSRTAMLLRDVESLDRYREFVAEAHTAAINLLVGHLACP
jgi:hypothetical protein